MTVTFVAQAGLVTAHFPWTVNVTTRFGDLDPAGGLGSTAIARYFEQARVTFIDLLLRAAGPAADDLPLMVVAGVAIDYVSEGGHGSPVRVDIGVDRVGRSSFAMAALCTQNCKPLALHAATMVLPGSPLPGFLSNVLRRHMVRRLSDSGDDDGGTRTD
jgi:acyl-CoA thioester hydrolase